MQTATPNPTPKNQGGSSTAEHPMSEFDPQQYYDPNQAPSGALPDGMQTYIGEDGNQYYYYYQPDGATNGATDEYDSDQNPMSEFYAAAAQGAAQRAAADRATSAATSVGGPAVTVLSPTATGGGSTQQPTVPLGAVADTLMRTYEFEDWTPPSHGWLIDVSTEVFHSLGFRLYFTYLMLCAGSIIFFLCMNFIFATLYRLFDPPTIPGAQTLWQSMAYLAIFLIQSFVTVAVFCTWMDMLKGLWGSTRLSTSLWGFSHGHIGKDKPPYIVHTLVVGFTTLFPLAWAIIGTAADRQTVLYIASTFFYISINVVLWFVAICYGWFYWQALKQKRLAYARRFKSDDLREQRIINQGQIEKHVKGNWYYSESALEEYGLERKVVSWSAPVFMIGLIPIFAIMTSVVRDARLDNPQNSWVAIGVIFISVLLLLLQMTSSKNHAHRTVFIAIGLITLLFILGLIGCGVSGSGSMFGILFVLMLGCHCMLLRKRAHSLTRKEVCALMQIAIDKEDEEERRETRLDTYMCCCRNSILASIQWLDIKTMFGYRHPKVREFEKQLVIQQPTLRTDYKVLLLWWLSVFFCLIFVVAIGRAMSHNFSSSSIAYRQSQAFVGSNPTLPVCSFSYNVSSSLRFGPLDLALLSAVGSTWGEASYQTYAQWFYHIPTLKWEVPAVPPSSRQGLATGNSIPYYVFHDTASDYRFIVIRQQMLGSQLLQGLDYFGDGIALTMAQIAAPLISGWSSDRLQAFIKGTKFFKQGLDQGFDPLADVMAYIKSTSSYSAATPSKSKIVIVGEGFNGGYSKIISQKMGLTSMSFNAPGITSTLTSALSADANNSKSHSTQVDIAGSLMSLIDPHLDEVDTRYSLPCPESLSLNECSDISIVIHQLVAVCGDKYGRTIVV